MTTIETLTAKRNGLQQALAGAPGVTRREGQAHISEGEHAAIMAELRATKAQLGAARRAQPVPDAPVGRSLAEIEAEQEMLRAERRAARRLLVELERERNAAIVAAEVAAMPDARKAALRQVLGAAGIPSAAAVGTPASK